MLENGADPNARNLVGKARWNQLIGGRLSYLCHFCLQETGMTALMEAAKVGFLELVRAILGKGADPNMADGNQLTAVHYAAMGSFLEVQYLLFFLFFND